MKDFVAETESGATLSMNRNLFSRNGSSYGKAGRIKVVDLQALESIPLEEQGARWEYIRSLDKAEMPEVGKLLYADYMDWWYLSTPIVSVKVFGESAT